MVNLTFLAGGYDPFVATYLFNTLTLTLSLVGRSSTGANPSWITLNSNNHSVLYATNENFNGALQSFTIDSNTHLLSSPIDTIPSSGDLPAHAAYLPSTSQIAVMNYQSGTGRFVSFSGAQTKFDFSTTSTQGISFPQPGYPGASHPHQTVEIGNGEVLVPDLGGDTIYRILKTPGTGEWKIQTSYPQPKGSGPRHIAVVGDRLFALHELASTLSVQSLPSLSSQSSSQTFATVSILPPVQPSNAQWAAAEILIPPPTSRFPKSYIYVSNRNTDPNAATNPGDTIAIFEHVNKGQSNEGLMLVKQIYTGLNQIRGMQIGNGGSEEFLVASGVAGTGGVVVFRRVDGGRDLVEVARNHDVATRTSFVWL